MWKSSTTIKQDAAEQTTVRASRPPARSNDEKAIHELVRAPGPAGGQPRPLKPTRPPAPEPTPAARAGLPDRVTAHPGEVLREEFLKPLGLSVSDLAVVLCIPTKRVAAIIRADSAITADTALRLARYFGNTPEFWFGLQAMHDLTRAWLDAGRRIEREIRPRNGAG